MATAYHHHAGGVRRVVATPQTEPIPGREDDMKQNLAGGYVFTITPWKQLTRFLILGCSGGSYYASEKEMTKDNAKVVLALLKKDGPKVVQLIADVSTKGRAYKQDPALYALALAFSEGDAETQAAVKKVFNDVVRIGTHLFKFVEYTNAMRGWGRGLRELIQGWYVAKDASQLAFQVTKYAQREGWAHKDVLRLAHVKVKDAASNAVLRYVVGGMEALGARTVQRKHPKTGKMRKKEYPTLKRYLPEHIKAVEAAKTATVPELVKLIKEHNLPREVIPSEQLNEIRVWEALLEDMPMTATIRNLGKMTSIGLLKPMTENISLVINRIMDPAALKKARVHPIQILAAFLTYRQGHGFKGKLTWEPNQQIADALDEAFYLSFGFVEPTGKRIVFGIDCSGSMGGPEIEGVPGLVPRIGAAAMAMVAARTEKQYVINGFTDTFVDLRISAKDRLDSVIDKINRSDFGGTDCSLPMVWADRNGISADAFVVITDNETWAGHGHPVQALRAYRKKTGIAAKLAVIGMTTTESSIADPTDSGMMDFVGFDTDTPTIMSDFIRGDL